MIHTRNHQETAGQAALATRGCCPEPTTRKSALRAHHDGCAAPVVLAATHERTLEVVPLETLKEHSVDVPDDLTDL
ncbi:hypothetical protein I545_4028 [Mycobacterium kansasii 662]|uniref:Uncharacterized protein n=1 Tax=Mycobacterium kansasii 662 TaxID=1299326 RepID=X7ZCE5_MYCKA|nr:hypothetical protein I545_4028 [Mycobacterium kansasii 662]